MQISSRVCPLNTRLPYISNQYAAPFRVSMATPRDVIAVEDSGTEGDSRSAQLRYFWTRTSRTRYMD